MVVRAKVRRVNDEGGVKVGNDLCGVLLRKNDLLPPFFVAGRDKVTLVGRVEVALVGRAEVALVGRVEVALVGRVEVALVGRAEVALGRAEVALGRAEVALVGRARVRRVNDEGGVKFGNDLFGVFVLQNDLLLVFLFLFLLTERLLFVDLRDNIRFLIE